MKGIFDLVSEHSAYNLNWDRATKRRGAPITVVDLDTGKRTKGGLFAPPKGLELGSAHNWGRLKRLGASYVVAVFEARRSDEVAFFYDPIQNKLGKQLRINPRSACVDGAEEHMDHGWR